MTRAENLQIWQLIADGILREDIPQDGEVCYAQETALTFIQQVAADILAADKSRPNQRAEQILKAVGLANRLDPEELEKRRAVQLVDDFFADLPKKEKEVILLGLLREELGVPGVLDEKTDEERLRQIKSYRKKESDKK